MIHFNTSKILIPVDFSETSLLAIKHGGFTAQLTKGDVYLLHVINTHFMAQNMFIPVVNSIEVSQIETKATEKINQIANDIRKEYGVNVQCIVKTGVPSSEIVNVAEEIKASLIVMGTHGYAPLEELVIGSNALKVLTKAPCPTMAMSKAAEEKGYQRILMPIDTSAHSRQKVNYTLEMAKQFSASVHAIALIGANETDDKPALELIMSQIEKLAKEKKVPFHSEILSDVKNRATATIKYSEKNEIDLIVIMTDQDAELSGFFLGPYSQQVIHHSKVPVIAIKPYINEDGGFSILAGTAGN